MQDSEAAGGLVARAANRFVGKADREAASVLSNAQRHTHFLDSPRIASCMAHSDFAFSDLRHRITSVFLVLPPTSPAPLPDDELRETLDLMATAVASISDRVHKTATKARQAAFAARKQTDPETYGKLVAETVDGKIGETLQRMEHLANHLELRTGQTTSVLDRASQDRGKALRDLHAREQKLKDFRRRLPWVGLGALVLVIALILTLPRFMAGNASTCAVLGASWTTTTSGVEACVFFQR